mmetsp:Transcript_30131/g.72330  ORF Transcript_30131/g.72330 Transcript_30131/m.72330 type:complete len:162 (-) Transcript_30131:69-554(-)|eukprot:CAMPEP_0113619466 /NCGR_PEP_ID=MMETSP0017_2-20120614/9885_1 /TAXON_ID=2856 /ORGANISM="Cylindrotheca closterium" /LENGTH=161 /DNA_ID=CAMNT_0000529043 /DNA_START=92 /DNA_END=577 /DNA_ORIENTATION=- /assembly_acc=CAM_ASM_000147
MPSLIWSTAYAFLLVELVITAILVVPVPIKIRNAITRKVFQFDLGERIRKPILFIAIALAMGFVDSYSKHQYVMEKIDEERNAELDHGHHLPHVLHHEKEKKYKAERNMYLTGFALTLLFVIGRICQLMQEHVELENELHPETAVEKREATPKKPVDKKND